MLEANKFLIRNTTYHLDLHNDGLLKKLAYRACYLALDACLSRLSLVGNEDFYRVPSLCQHIVYPLGEMEVIPYPLVQYEVHLSARL